MPRKKVGLALGSGGARGLAHIGALRVLEKHNIPIDYIAGCSMGSWVGAHYALYKDVDKLEKEAIGEKRKKLSTFLDLTFKGGLVKGKKVRKFIREGLEDSSFSDLQIPLKIVATDLVKAEPYVFSSGELTIAVQASSCIPTLFKPIEYKNTILVDGGISNPVPDDIVRSMGADIVLSISLDNCKRNYKFTKKDLTISGTARRSLELMRYFLADYSLQNSDIIIKPCINWPSNLRKYFIENALGPRIIKIGEKETEAIIPKLKKLLK